MAHIQVEDLWFAYPGGPPVLRGVDLAIGAGEYVALIGQNGAGKTTLAKHLVGIHRPARGRVLIDGEDARSLSIAALAGRVGYCYQNPDHQIFEQTIQAEVAFGPRNQGLAPEQVAERVEEALRAAGLWEERLEAPHFAGKGERQRIAVASVLAMRPEVIVLDEPTTGLDWAGTREMMALVERLNAEGRTILIITHDMRLVAEYARRVVVMGQGQVLLDGGPAEAFARQDLLRRTALQPPQIARLSLAVQPWAAPALTPAELAERFDVTAAGAVARVGTATTAAGAFARAGAAADMASMAAEVGTSEATGSSRRRAHAAPRPQGPGHIRLHPGAKLALFAGLAVLPFTSQSPLLLTLFLIATLLAARVAAMPGSGWRLWRVLGLVGGLMTFVTWLPFLSGGPVLATATVPGTAWRLQFTSLGLTWGAAMALRIAAAALACVGCIATTPPRRITMGLRAFGLPYPAAFLLSLAFRLLPVSQRDAAMIREAQEVRGLDLNQGSLPTRARRYAAILGPLVLTALRRVRLIANALDARGFQLRGGAHRLYGMPRWRWADVAAVLAVALGLAGAVYLRVRGLGVLLPDRL